MYYLRREPYTEGDYNMPNDITLYQVIFNNQEDLRCATVEPTGTPDRDQIKVFRFNSLLEALNVRDEIAIEWSETFDIYDENGKIEINL